MKKSIKLDLAFWVEPSDQDALAHLQQALENVPDFEIEVQHIEELEVYLLAKIEVKGECLPATPFEGFVLNALADALAHTGISMVQSSEDTASLD